MSLKESLRGARPHDSNHSKLRSLPKVDGSISSVSNGIHFLDNDFIKKTNKLNSFGLFFNNKILDLFESLLI